MKLVAIISFLFVYHQCAFVVESHENHHQKNQIVSQLKREVLRLREKDEALEEEVKHLRKEIEEQLVNVAKFLSSPCQHGKPYYENHFKCQCDQGWTGDKCQYNYNCQCKNGGVCTNLEGNYTCDCSNTGYRGRQCEELIDACSSGLCQNGGVCTSQPGGYNCKCNPGYTGKNCQIIEVCAKEGEHCVTDPNTQMSNPGLKCCSPLLECGKRLQGYTVNIQNISTTRRHLDFKCFNKGVSMTLHEAAKEGDLDVVIHLTEKDPASVNNTANYGLTPLFFAAMEGKYEVVKYLVEEGEADASINIKGGLTPLLIGAERGWLDVVKYLVEKTTVSVDIKTNDGETPLYLATREGHLDVVTYLVKEAQADAFIKKDGSTPFHWIAAHGWLNVVKYLVEQNPAGVDITNNKGETALYLAAEEGHLEVVKYLVEEAQADAFIKKNGFSSYWQRWKGLSAMKGGLTPFHEIARWGWLEMVQYLVGKKPSEVNINTNLGKTPLLVAENICHDAADCSSVVEYLKPLTAEWTALQEATKKGQIDVVKRWVDKWGHTPIHMMAQFGQLDVMKFFVEKNQAVVNSTNSNGETLIYLAAEGGNLDVVKYLVGYSAGVDIKDRYEQTPVYRAAVEGHHDVVKYLAEEGKADATIKNLNGWTPLHLIAQRGWLDVVKYLAVKNSAAVDIKDSAGETPLDWARYFCLGDCTSVIAHLKSFEN